MFSKSTALDIDMKLYNISFLMQRIRSHFIMNFVEFNFLKAFYIVTSNEGII